MTASLLVWLLLLPLLAVALVPAPVRGPAVARVLVLAFAVGTFLIGVGDTSLPALTAFARDSPEGALFVSLSAGLLLGGALPWPPREWRHWLPAMPLVLAGVVAAWPAFRVGPWLLGGVLGAVPALLGSALPAAAQPATVVAAPERTPIAGWIAVLVTVALAALDPMAAALLPPVIVVAAGAARPSWLPRGRVQLVLPVVATVAGVALGWLALTVAGDALAALSSFFVTAPVSTAAERWLALFAVITVAAMLAPWPLSRFGPGLVLAPAAAVLAFRLALSVAPSALGDWQPLLGLVLVPSAVMAALRGRWPTSLATVAVLAALRPGPLAVVAAAAAMLAALALVAVAPGRNLLDPGRVTFAGTWWHAVLATVGAVIGVMSVLQHEVVLATLLTAGLACAAARVRVEPKSHAVPPT